MSKEEPFIKNVCSCRICGASADKVSPQMYQCQAHPGHIADTFTGIFSDCTYPSKDNAS